MMVRPSPLTTWASRWAGALPPRRLVTIGAAGVMGAGVGYGISALLRLGTQCNGGCPTASDPAPFVLLLTTVAAWSAISATRR
ncbi:MAG: hypothetical protein JW751_09385 [Polyangiaceae bacterium]|nr:hypothetical protein [Polyangiaceae bacterium]